MNYLKLEYFYRVAKHQHMTKAAEELHISQPALTKMIKQLEDELDMPLFVKKGRGISLTEFGCYLKQRLDEIIPAIDNLEREIETYKVEARTRVKLNVLAASTIVTDAVVSYKKLNAEVTFQLIQNEEETDCDIIVTTNASELSRMPELQKKCVMEEKIYLAVPRNSEYASRDSIELHEVADERFVQLAGSRLFRSVCDKYCAYTGFTPYTVFESDSPMAVKNIIGANAGVGFWPEYSWGEASSFDIALVPIVNPICQREIIVGVCDKKSVTALTYDFYEYLIGFIKERQQR